MWFVFFRFELQRERSSTSGSVEEPQIKETTAEQDGKVTMHSETIWKYQSMKRIRFKIWIKSCSTFTTLWFNWNFRLEVEEPNFLQNKEGNFFLKIESCIQMLIRWYRTLPYCDILPIEINIKMKYNFINFSFPESYLNV